MFINTFFVSILFYYEKNINVMINTSIGAIVNVILNYYLLQCFGYVAAAYTTIVGYLIIFLLNMFVIYKKEHNVFRQIYIPRIIVFSIAVVFFSMFLFIKLYSMNPVIRWILFAVCMFCCLIKYKKIISLVQQGDQ